MKKKSLEELILQIINYNLFVPWSFHTITFNIDVISTIKDMSSLIESYLRWLEKSHKDLNYLYV